MKKKKTGRKTNRTAKSTNKTEDAADLHPGFAPVVAAFAKDRQVSRELEKGFGAGSLKVKGKIFAMMSSKGWFVVKLPKERVDGLVNSGQGAYFDPGHGRLMKEWVVVRTGTSEWIDLAKEAKRFVGGAKK